MPIAHCTIQNTYIAHIFTCTETVFELKGGTTYLNCSLLESVAGMQESVQDITWSFTGINGSTQTIYQSSSEMMSDRYFVNANRTDPQYRQLTIRGVVYEDSGSYRCFSDDTVIDTKVVLVVHGKKVLLHKMYSRTLICIFILQSPPKCCLFLEHQPWKWISE